MQRNACSRLVAVACVLSSVMAPLMACASGSAPVPGPAPALSYELDGLPRTLDVGEQLPCERSALPLVTYKGELLKYHKPVRVHPAFLPQLRAFEQIVQEVALRHYGRAPRRIVHLGAYACRRMRRYPTWVSEHAIGNAIDVAGFDFAPLPARDPAPTGLPKKLRGAFEVRLEKHWTAEGPNAAHAGFLRALAQAVIDRPDVFHVILGPAWPGHHNHFHLDHAPYRVVEVF